MLLSSAVLMQRDPPSELMTSRNSIGKHGHCLPTAGPLGLLSRPCQGPHHKSRNREAFTHLDPWTVLEHFSRIRSLDNDRSSCAGGRGRTGNPENACSNPQWTDRWWACSITLNETKSLQCGYWRCPNSHLYGEQGKCLSSRCTAHRCEAGYTRSSQLRQNALRTRQETPPSSSRCCDRSE